MSTCQTAIVKTRSGEALSLNLFTADEYILEKAGVEAIEKVFKKLEGTALMIVTDVGTLSLGNILELNTGRWGNNGEVNRVTCQIVIEPNSLSNYLMDKGVHISGTVLALPRGIQLLSYIDKVSNLGKEYDLSKFMENKHAARK